MNPPTHEPRVSLLSELLLYHSVLGRGYISPFPVTRGMVFTSALPNEALQAMTEAEMQFRRFHEQAVAEDKRQLAQVEGQPEHMLAVTGMTKTKLKELKEKVTKRAHIVWTEDQTLKTTIVELLKTHYYGSFTYLDSTGARLGISLAHPAKLAGDMGWTSLMEGTTEEMFIRAGATGGALIHSLTGVRPIFNFYCNCKEQQLDKLIDKVKHTSQGQVGLGTTIALRGRASIYSGTSADTLFSLARRVFAKGDRPDDQRVRVYFAHSCDQEWRKFIQWKLPDLLDDPDPAAWQWKLAQSTPTSPANAVLFGARAAMVAAFIQAAEINQDGPMRELQLDEHHLASAKEMARAIYRSSSGQEGFEKRIKNLKNPHDIFTTTHKLQIAKTAIEEAVEKSAARRLSRNQVRYEVMGATLGLLDELVRTGDIAELCGIEECKMGKTVRAYTLPKYAPPGDPLDAVAEYEEALLDYEASPDAFQENAALLISRRLREKAEHIYSEHFLPVVSLSRMSKAERHMLPKLLDMFPHSFLLRGDAANIPEPSSLMDDEDTPLDRGGANLWVRHRMNGDNFCDWNKAGKLKLSQVWGVANDTPVVVPA